MKHLVFVSPLTGGRGYALHRMPKDVSPASIRKTLENKDYLRYSVSERHKSRRVISEEELRLRRKSLVILVAGTKGSGKSKLADTICAVLQGGGYSVLSSRASRDAEQEIYTKPRRELLARQKEGRAEWNDVVAAIRGEAASALEKRVMPYLVDSTSGNERKVVVLSRYPPVDTLARQYLAGAPPHGVAQVLRGSNFAPPGYLTPELVLVLTCEGKEATKRVIYRDTHISTEISAGLPPDFADEIDRQTRAYHLVSGYNPTTKQIDKNEKMHPGETYVIDTSAPDLNYDSDPREAMEEVETRAVARANRIIDEIIMPKLRNGRNHQ